VFDLGAGTVVVFLHDFLLCFPYACMIPYQPPRVPEVPRAWDFIPLHIYAWRFIVVM
jgi:hypothetical protein